MWEKVNVVCVCACVLKCDIGLMQCVSVSVCVYLCVFGCVFDIFCVVNDKCSL